MRKTANPLSRKAFRAVSFSATKDSSSQASYRLRRAFSFHCKAHRALILLLLASKPQPLCWVAVWVRRFAAVSPAKSALRPRSFLPLPEKNVIRPLPCSSFPTATRCAGLAVGGLPCGRDFSRLRNVDFNHPFQMNITRTPAFSKAALREGCGCDVNNRKKGCQWYNYHWRLSFFDILL